MNVVIQKLKDLKNIQTKKSKIGSRVLESEDGNDLYFVKIGTGGESAEKNILEYEKLGLEKMIEATRNSKMKIPKPILVDEISTREGFIVLDYIDFANKSNQSLLGECLADMHLYKDPNQKTFGFPINGSCGSFKQLNNIEQKEMSWVDFWKEFRFDVQLNNLKEEYNDIKLFELGIQVRKKIPDLFSELIVEDIRPSLLHGDLWSGNIGFDKNGNPSIFDPACYFGHHEADFGITRMFGGMNHTAFESYHKKIPKSPGFEKRALLYELHHHMNHYNMFGSGYRSGCVDLMNKICKN